MRTLITAILLLSSAAFAQVKVIEGQYGLNTQMPTNYIKNKGCYKNVAGIAASGGSLARNTSGALENGADCQIDASASAQTYSWATNSFDKITAGQNCEARLNYLGNASDYMAYVMVGGVKASTDLQLQNSGTSIYPVSINFPCGAQPLTTNVVIESTSASAAAIQVAGVYAGLATNLSNISQATLYGGAEQVGASGCGFSENTSTGTTDFKDMGTGTGCNAWTTAGSVSVVGTNDHRIVLNNLPAGEYVIQFIGSLAKGTSASSGTCLFRLSDGTTSYQPQTIGIGATSYLSANILSFQVSKTSGSNNTYKLQAADDHSAVCGIDNSVTSYGAAWKVYRFPASSEIALNSRLPILPTVQTFTSGSGTYTKPNGVSYIKVRMVGAGGSGGSSGSASATAGAAGGSTTFGGYTAGFGQGGGLGNGSTIGGGGAGGAIAGSIATTALSISVTGTTGSSGWQQGGTPGTNTSGGFGGSNLIGQGGMAQAGGSGQLCRGYGSGGAGGGGSGSTFAAGGGGAGGYAEFLYPNPPATISYSVGTGGAARTAGTSGFASSAGCDGYIEVTEYYQNANAPLLVNSVISRDNSSVTTIATTISVAANYTATDREETIFVDTTAASRTITLPPAASYKGKIYEIVQTNSANQVIIDPNGSETVCGATTIRLSGNKDSVTLQSNGTSWFGLNGSCYLSASAYIQYSAGTPTAARQYPSNWLSSVTDTAAGRFTLVPKTGAFSDLTTCSATPRNSSASQFANIDSGISWDATAIPFIVGTGAGTDVDASIVCYGPR